MQGSNEEFFLYFEKKMIRRVQVLAKFKKESMDLDKGALLFGKQYNQKASADFLKLLLLYIKQWGTTFYYYQNSQRQSEINKLFQNLQKEHVHFPQEENVMQSLCIDYHADQNRQGSPSSTVQSSMNQSQVERSRSSQVNQFQTHQQQNQLNKVQDLSVSEQAKKIKNNYKKLSDYMETKKLYDDLLQEGYLDDELLTQMRQQMQEGKDFTEDYLQLIMETQVNIKDKQQKVDKILGILHDLSDQLDRVLKLKPYSPRSLEKLKKCKEEVKKDTKQEDPQNIFQVEVAETMSTPAPGGLRKKTRNKNRNIGNESQRNIQSSQQIENLQNTQDIFKKNFMSQTPQVDLQKSSLAQPFWLNNKQFDQPDDINEIDNQQHQQQDVNQFDYEEKKVEKKEQKKEQKGEEKSEQKKEEEIKQETKIQQQVKQEEYTKSQLQINGRISNISEKQTSNKKEPVYQGLDRFGVIQKQVIQPKVTQFSPDSNISSENDDHNFQECNNGNAMQDTFNFSPAKQNDQNQDDFFKFELQPVQVADNISNAFDFNFNNTNQQQQSEQQLKRSPSKPESRQERPEIKIKDVEDPSHHEKEEELEKENKGLKEQNIKLKAQLEKFNDITHKQDIQIQQESSERQKLKVEIDKLKKEVKELKKYEFMYSDMNYVKENLEKETSSLKVQLQEYKLSLERYESKLIKKESEIDKLSSQIKIQEDLTDQINSKDREIEKLKKLIEEKEKIEDGLRSSLRQAEERNESPYHQNFKIIKSSKQSSSPDQILKIKKNKIQQVISITSSTPNSQANQEQQVSKFEFEHQQPPESRQEGFSLDTFLTSNQPKAFEQENLELVDPLALQKAQSLQKQESQKMNDVSYEEMMARVPSGDSDIEESQMQDTQKQELDKQEVIVVQQQKSEVFEYDKNDNNNDEFQSAKSEPDEENNQKVNNDDMINFFGDLKKQNEEKKEIYNNPNDDFWDFTSFKQATNEVQNKQVLEVNNQIQGNEAKQDENKSEKKEVEIHLENKKVLDQKNDDLLWIFDTEVKKENDLKDQNQKFEGQKTQVKQENESKIQDLLEFDLLSNNGNEINQQQLYKQDQKEQKQTQQNIIEKKKQLEQSLDQEKVEKNQTIQKKETQEVQCVKSSEKSQDEIIERSSSIISRENSLKKQKGQQETDRQITDRHFIQSQSPQIAQQISSQSLEQYKDILNQENSNEKNIKFQEPGTPQQNMKSNIKQGLAVTLSQGSNSNHFQKISQSIDVFDSIFKESCQDDQLIIQKDRSSSLKQSQEKTYMIDRVQEQKSQQLVPFTNTIYINEHSQPNQAATSNRFYSHQQNMSQSILPSQLPNNNQQMANFQTNTNYQQQSKDIKINTSQFSTSHANQFLQEQQQQQQQQININPQMMLMHVIQQYFKKSLVAHNKSILFEDKNIQIGIIIEFQSNMAKMKLFFGNKSKQFSLQQVIFKHYEQQNQNYQLSQSKEIIHEIQVQKQDCIEFQFKINSYQIPIPVCYLSYKINNIPNNNIPLKLPIVIMKFCTGVTYLDAKSFNDGWNQECGPQNQSHQYFTMDLNQCKSLSQLKENLMFGKKAIQFIDGVEQQRNIVCGATMFQLQQIFALIKLTITQTGKGCEIVIRSSDKGGMFGRQVLMNILELIALK